MPDEAEPLPLVVPTERYRRGDKGFEGQVARLPNPLNAISDATANVPTC